jgi:uncharacterized repeat protein (TIGR03803 family)
MKIEPTGGIGRLKPWLRRKRGVAAIAVVLCVTALVVGLLLIDAHGRARAIERVGAVLVLQGGTACTDGEGPQSIIIQGSDGNFYGTTYGGGANGDYGTVFKRTPSGNLATLHSFCSVGSFPDCGDGFHPAGSGVIQGSDGNFYGTTNSEGDGDSGCTVFEMTPSGALTTLYSFCSQTSSQASCTDGAAPEAGVI